MYNTTWGIQGINMDNYNVTSGMMISIDDRIVKVEC